MRIRPAGAVLFALLALGVAPLGCGSDETGSDHAIDCTDDEYYDQVYERCVPRQTTDPEETDAGPPGDATSPDTDGDDTAAGDTLDPDSGADTTDTADGDRDTGIPEECDRDDDRTRAESCGGHDCDDQDPNRSPNFPERCDRIDNDCSDAVNDGIECTFYAHESDKLFEINPFEKTATDVGADLPGLHDLDTHPDGTLFGVTPDGFYRFDDQTEQWTQLKPFRQWSSWAPTNPNGMAIDRSGTIFITSEDTLYTIKKQDENGETQWWVEEVGEMGTSDSGSNYVSSGDAVIYKKTLRMTSKHSSDQDHLVQLDPSTASASNPLPIGYQNVFGLTTAWGELYGVTRAGELIAIDPQTGDTELVHEFDHRWYGAASTPRRDGRRSK